MYIRKKDAKGKTYYSVVRSERDKFGRVKQINIVSLGTHNNLPDAIFHTEGELIASYKLGDEFREKLMEIFGPPPFPDFPEWPKWALNAFKKIRNRTNELHEATILMKQCAQKMNIKYESNPDFIMYLYGSFNNVYVAKEGLTESEIERVVTKLNEPIEPDDE
jgi:hypothetical protein